jgi:hypothetical protein
LVWDTKDRGWKKSAKGLATTTNFLEVLVNDEETTLSKFELHLWIGKTHVF